MGVKKYFKWLKTEFSSSFSSGLPKAFSIIDHVYIDMNSILHELFYYPHVANEESYHEALFQRLDSIFRMLKPLRTVYFGIDGSPPLAKVKTQRNRRLRRPEKVRVDEDSPTIEEFGPNLITPGLPFMTRLSIALEYYLASRMSSGILSNLEVQGTISSSSTPGEAEMKVKGQVLRNINAGYEKDTHLLVSNDSDSILLAVMQVHTPNIAVMYDTSSNNHAPGVWSYKNFIDMLFRKLSCNSANDFDQKLDFAILSLLCGNDYLPQLCDISVVWHLYTELNHEDTKLLKVQTVDQLPGCFRDDGWCKSIGDRGFAFTREPYVKFQFTTSFFDLLRKYASGNSERASEATIMMQENVKCYLKGLLWLLEAYHHGQFLDYSFNFKVDDPSMNICAADIVLLYDMGQLKDIEAPVSIFKPLSPLICAAMTLPYKYLLYVLEKDNSDNLNKDELSVAKKVLRNISISLNQSSLTSKILKEIASNVDPSLRKLEGMDLKGEIHIYYEEGLRLNVRMPSRPNLPYRFGSRQEYRDIVFEGAKYVGFWPQEVLHVHNKQRHEYNMHMEYSPQTERPDSDLKRAKEGTSGSSSNSKKFKAGGHRFRPERYYKRSFLEDPWKDLMPPYNH